MARQASFGCGLGGCALGGTPWGGVAADALADGAGGGVLFGSHAPHPPIEPTSATNPATRAVLIRVTGRGWAAAA
jgi:hypothetical protein